MVSTRQIRLLGVSAFFIFLVLVFYTSRESHDAVSSSVNAVVPQTGALKNQGAPNANSIIESANDEKKDAAINNEISQLSEDKKKPGSSAGTSTVIPKVNGVAASDDKKEDAITNVKVDPSDPNSPTTFDPAEEVVQIRAMSPMTIFSKTSCPYSKKIKKLFRDNYEITPVPTIVELDMHKHGAVLQAYLAELTGRATVPNVLVGTSSKSRGGSDDFLKLHEEGDLAALLEEWAGKKLSVRKINAPSNV